MAGPGRADAVALDPERCKTSFRPRGDLGWSATWTVPYLEQLSRLPARAPGPSWVDADPLVLHYHRRLTRSGFLERTGRPGTDRAIDSVNLLLRRSRHRKTTAEARRAMR
jgi:hypothetical protein